MLIYLEKNVQIEAKTYVEILLFDKPPIIISTKYLNYSNIFSIKNTAEFLEHIGINSYIIKLEKDKLPLFKPIYKPKLVKLEILKVFIKINLAKRFIQLFKSFIGIPILFN